MVSLDELAIAIVVLVAWAIMTAALVLD